MQMMKMVRKMFFPESKEFDLMGLPDLKVERLQTQLE